ncbi:MAG: hypothetical protein NTV80_08075, partial [Verrucomicrobia bacterium]|nr:hypothetical protein [Verrucomicrobiota bacterium]
LQEALTLRYQAKVSDIPKPRPVAAPIVAPPETEPVADKPRIVSADRPKPKPEADVSEPETTEETEKQRRSFFSRLNPFSSKKTSDEDVIAAAIDEAAKEEAQSRAESEDTTTAEEPKPSDQEVGPVVSNTPTKKSPKPLFERWFGSDSKPKEEVKEDTKPELPKAEAEAKAKAPVVKVAPAPTEEDIIKPAKKPSLLNPLNWFRDSKPKTEKTEDVSTPETPATIKPADVKKQDEAPKTSLLMDWQMVGTPLVASIYQEAAVEEPAKEKKRLFGLFGGKKKEAETPETKPEKPAPAKEELKTKRSPIRIQPLFGKSQPKTEEPKDETKAPDKVEAPAKKPSKPTTPASTQAAPEPSQDMPVEMPVEKPATTPEPKAKPPAPTKETAPEPTAAAAIPIDDYAAIMKRPDRKEILQYNLIALSALQQRCAILFRPIVADYTTLVTEIRDGKAKDVEARLKKLRVRTQAAVDQSKAVRDLLDTHEANDTPVMSGLFDEYLRLPETLKKELPERKDPISIYLDALDREFSKP